MKSQIEADLQRCSGQHLAPLLDKIQALLPLELRECVYEHIFDTSKPIIIPRIENSDSTLTAIHSWSDESSRLSKFKPMDPDPFNHEYCFSTTVMGTQTSAEVRNLVLRKTPFYFRCSKNAPYVKDLLEIAVQPGMHFRDCVRNLRFYFRCETFMSDAKFLAPGVSAGITEPRSRSILFHEPTTYDMYWARLDGLETLNYSDHTIVLEICVFTEKFSRQPKVKRSLYEMIEQVYIHAKNGGADVKVRHEDFSTGNGEDWTEHLAISGQQWIQSTCALGNTPTSSASLLRDLFDAPIPNSETNISWKHGLFDGGRYPQCHCTPCERFARAICLSCGNAHCGRLDENDDEGNDVSDDVRSQMTIRRRRRNEQRVEATTERGQASGS